MKPSKNRPKPAPIDCGPNPFVGDVSRSARQNPYFRAAAWTGKYLQLTLMCIPPEGDVGLETHPVDQYIRVESGCGCTMMGGDKDNLKLQQEIWEGMGVFVPAGTWHNIVNTGRGPLKLSSVYAPPHHPHGTIHQTQAVANQEEDGH